MSDDDMILRWFDEEVLEAGEDGAKLSDTIDAVCKRVENDPEGAGVPTDSELRRAWVERAIRSERTSRKDKRLALFLHVNDALNDDTILGHDDPVLDLAMRTGAHEGIDKAMRFWAIEDWLEALGASAANVGAVIEADRQPREIVNPIIAQYAQRRIRILGDAAS